MISPFFRRISLVVLVSVALVSLSFIPSSLAKRGKKICETIQGYKICVTCGDGVLEDGNDIGPYESCDDGNRKAGDGCDAICHTEPGWTCTDGIRCHRGIWCGDKNTDWPETCDRGKKNGQGYCAEDCQVISGWVCDYGKYCHQLNVCGDKYWDWDMWWEGGNEKCDMGTNNGKNLGCTTDCKVQQGWNCHDEGWRSYCQKF